MLLEDGFLRSVSPGPRDAPLSVVVDDLGIYYDATRASRLELLVLATQGVEGPAASAIRERAAALVEAWRSARVSK